MDRPDPRPSAPLAVASAEAQLAPEPAGRAAPAPRFAAAPGLALACVLGAVATVVGHLVPVVGAPVVGVALGIATVGVLGERPALGAGVRVATHVVLRAAIVLLGFTIPLGEVWKTAAGTAPVMLGTLAAGLATAAVAGRLLGVRGDRQLLIGIGTAICGASAIAATASVLEPEEDDVAYAITVIFVFNVAAVLTFPVFGHLLHQSGHAFGLWAGTAVNDMSSVVAATSVFGHGSIGTGVVVKLARTLMIVPIVAALAASRSRRHVAGRAPEPRRRSLRRVVPGFLVLFVLASLVRSAGVVGTSFGQVASQASLLAITVALAGVGLSARPAHIRRAGFRPLVLGAACWAAVALASLGLQAIA